jgi:hypothetical protein
MKRKETQRYAPNRFNKVFDGRNRRVRGLWERNGVYYAQVQVQSWVGRVPLEHSGTVASATDALQDLKSKIRAGTFIPPRRQQAGEELARIFHKMTGFSRLARVPEEKSRWTALVFWRRHGFGRIPL